VVEEDAYPLELVRYLHLNPLRAKVVPDLHALGRYPWTGHSALLGAVPRAWQDTQTILAQFGPTTRRARRAYRTFVAASVPHGRRPDLQGGGLIRSIGGWAAVAALRRGREAYEGDERILGSLAFVEATRTTLSGATALPLHRLPLAALLAAVATATGVTAEALAGPGRARRLTRARAGVGRAGGRWRRHSGSPIG
jgi:hypothetical protein